MNKLSGYCEVQLGEKLRPLKFGMGAWSIIATERNKALQDLFTGLNELEFIAWIAYGGMKQAALAGYTELKPPISVNQVMDWLEDADSDTMALIGKTFADSKIHGKTVKDLLNNIEDDKKKAKPKTSTT